MMDQSKSAGGQWLKYSCLGCLGIVVLVFVVIGGIVGIAWNRAGSARIEEQVLSQDLPRPGESPGVPPGALAEDMPEAEGILAGSPGGRVILDLSDADFHIDQGLPGEAVRIEASYDLDSYKLEESFEQAAGGAWTYRVGFRREGTWGVISILSQIISGNSPRVDIFIPPDAPVALDLNLRQGGGRLDLGGLWLTSADLEVSRGGFDVRFSEPLREPIQSLSIDVSMGGVSFASIGNASPRALSVTHRMGGMELDLRGQWRENARIAVSSSMGGAIVRLPEGVGIEGLDQSGKDRVGPEGSPLLTFTVEADMGELEFVD